MAEKQVSIMHWSLRRVRELENGNKPPTKIPKKAQLKARDMMIVQSSDPICFTMRARVYMRIAASAVARQVKTALIANACRPRGTPRAIVTPECPVKSKSKPTQETPVI
jgi:hypothetical protein